MGFVVGVGGRAFSKIRLCKTKRVLAIKATLQQLQNNIGCHRDFKKKPPEKEKNFCVSYTPPSHPSPTQVTPNGLIRCSTTRRGDRRRRRETPTTISRIWSLLPRADEKTPRATGPSPRFLTRQSKRHGVACSDRLQRSGAMRMTGQCMCQTRETASFRQPRQLGTLAPAGYSRQW